MCEICTVDGPFQANLPIRQKPENLFALQINNCFFYDKNNGIKWDTKTIFLLFCLPSFYRSKVSVI